MTKKMSEILEDCRVMVQNSASDSEIKTGLSNFGYTDEVLASGVTLYDDTLALFNQQHKEKLDVRSASNHFQEQKATVEDNYVRIVKLTRIAFKNNADLAKMIPTVVKNYPFDEFILGMHKFYSAIYDNRDAIALLAKFQITQESIQTLIDELKALEAARNSQENEKGDAQQIIIERNEKVDELREYCSDLKGIAEIAFSDKPQLLEKLGIIVRS